MAYDNSCTPKKTCYNNNCKTDKYQKGTFQAGFPQGPVYPQIVLHLPPPRVNGDNAYTSCVFIRESIIAAYSFFMESVKKE